MRQLLGLWLLLLFVGCRMGSSSILRGAFRSHTVSVDAPSSCGLLSNNLFWPRCHHWNLPQRTVRTRKPSKSVHVMNHLGVISICEPFCEEHNVQEPIFWLVHKISSQTWTIFAFVNLFKIGSCFTSLCLVNDWQICEPISYEPFCSWPYFCQTLHNPGPFCGPIFFMVLLCKRTKFMNRSHEPICQSVLKWEAVGHEPFVAASSCWWHLFIF